MSAFAPPWRRLRAIHPRLAGGLAALLRPAYPAVEVRERQPLARVDNELTEVWYVFRDGQLVRGDE